MEKHKIGKTFIHLEIENTIVNITVQTKYIMYTNI